MGEQAVFKAAVCIHGRESSMVESVVGRKTYLAGSQLVSSPPKELGFHRCRLTGSWQQQTADCCSQSGRLASCWGKIPDLKCHILPVRA